MNFPLLKTFDVSPQTTEFLNRKFDEYKDCNPPYNLNKNQFDQSKGYQTGNLLLWEDKEFQEFIEFDTKHLISSHLEIDNSQVSYHWIHVLDYEKGGSMGYHTHMHNEDFVLFLYLKDCNSGDTVFHLNHHNEEYAMRTQVSVKPKEHNAALFSSLILHKGEHTEENKRIFVVGIRVDMTNGKEKK